MKGLPFLLAALLLAGTLHAAPSLDPAAAVAWADATVKTGVPKEERVYVLGPETRNEGSPPQPVVVRRIVSAKRAHALGDLGLNRFGKMPVAIAVYPAGGGGPSFTTGNGKSNYALRAGDLVTVRLGP